MVFWALVSLLRGGKRGKSNQEIKNSNSNSSGGGGTSGGGLRVSFERKSVPSVQVLTRIISLLPVSDAVKLLRLCQVWSGPAAEAFYASIQFKSSLAFPKLVNLISNPSQNTLHPYSLLIRELIFTGQAAEDLMMGDLKTALEYCTNLASLRLEGCTLVSNLVAQFLKEHAPFLSRVEFPGCQISDSFLLSLIRGVKSLRHIDVSYTNVSLSMLPILVRELQYLETLQMIGCHPSSHEMVDEYENSEFFLVGDSLKQMKSPLKQVDVSGTMIGDKMISYLCRHCDSLESLIMDGCSLITDDAITSVAIHSKNLKLLNLSYCDITDVALQSLAIYLPVNDEKPGQLVKNAEQGSYKDFSEYNPSSLTTTKKEQGICLELIVLTGCSSITANGITFLASKCPNLKTIVLDGCDRVTDWYFATNTLSSTNIPLAPIDTDVARLPATGTESKNKNDGVDASPRLEEGVGGPSPDLSAYSALEKLSHCTPSAFSSDDADSFDTALSDAEISKASHSHSQKSLHSSIPRKLSLNRQQVLDKTR